MPRPGRPGRRRSGIGTCDRGTGTQAYSKVAAHPRLDQRPPGVPAVRGSGQDGCGTPGSSPYRCFLPDLTGFGDPGCAGPNLQRRLPRPVLRTQTSAMEFGPAKADCRCRVPPAPHLARPRASLLGPKMPPRCGSENEAPQPLSATVTKLTQAPARQPAVAVRTQGARTWQASRPESRSAPPPRCCLGQGSSQGTGRSLLTERGSASSRSAR